MGILFQAGRRQIILLMLFIGFLSLAVFWTVIYQMYVNQKNQQTVFLSYMANTAKSMIESIINEEMILQKKVNRENILHQIRFHMKLNFPGTMGLGETGEVIVGYKDDKVINYIQDLRFSRETREGSISIQDTKYAVPMRLAVTGKSGSITALDYRGVKVLAAFESVEIFNIGIVAKIDSSEIQKPYLNGVAYSLILIVLIFGASGYITIRVGERIILINETREQKYRAYIAYAPVGMIVCDHNGKFLEVNDKAAEIMGYSRGELTTKNFGDLVPNKVIKVHLENSLINEMAQFFNADQKYVNNLGEEYHLLISVVRFSHQRYLGFITDITQVKEMEIRLKESEARLNIALETTRIGIWDWDIRKDEWFASPTYFTTLGYMPEKGPLDRNVWIQRTHPEDKEFISEKNNNVLLGTELAYQYEARMLHSNGTYHWVSVLGKVVEFDEEGKPMRMLGTRMDITRQKNLELELSSSEKKYRTLFESSNDAIMLLDEIGFFDCNARTLEIFGCTEKNEFIGNHPVRFSPPTQPGGEDSMFLAQDHIAKAFKDGFNEFEWMHKKQDGSIFPAEVLLTSLELNGKQVIQATVRDITQRKQIENQLLQSAKMATLGEMATGIAHEINQPLTVIKMGCQLINRSFKSGQLTDEFLQDQMEKFLRNIDRSTRIIDHLRIFGRKISDNLAAVDINIPITNALEMVASQLHHASVNLDLQLGKNLSLVLGEENSLEQVFINILINAVDALTTREIEKRKIHITTSYLEKENMISVIIGNNGPNIPDPILHKIFEPFFTTKPAGQGTGLGLSISYGIIQSMGGFFSVQNTDNGPVFITKLKTAIPTEL